MNDPPIANPPSASRSIVLVDADPAFLAQIERWILTGFRFACVGLCPDGETGLATIREQRPALALVGVALPGITGDQVIERLKAEALPTRLIAVAQPGDEGSVFRALDAGADGVLHKPLADRPAFLAALEEALADGCPLSGLACKLLVRRCQQSRPDLRLMALLSAREREVAALACQGLNPGAIAHELGISVATVGWHLKKVHAKLGVSSQTELQRRLLGGYCHY